MRWLTALLLSLLLAVTSVTMAVARLAEPMAPGLTLTLCSDQGTVEVALDANGNPVPPHQHLCPDCLAGHAAFDLPPAAGQPNPPKAQSARIALPNPSHLAGRPAPASSARAPPARLA